MDTKSIISQIDAEIGRLQQARAFLNGTTIKSGPGRSKRSVASTAAAPVKKRRTLSAEARAKIAAAQKARWAKTKKSAK